MLDITTSDRKASGLSLEELESFLTVTKELLQYYKGKTKRLKYCELCRTSIRITLRRTISIPICYSCPWGFIEGRDCAEWFVHEYNLGQLDRKTVFTMITNARVLRDKGFCKARIRMLPKWIRRLNALIARRKKGGEK